MDARELLFGLWKAALSAVDPQRLVSGYFATRLPRVPGRIGVFAAGKAAAAMAAGVPRGLASETLLVAPRGTRAPAGLRARVHFAAHPDPDRSSVEAAKAALAFFREFGPEDLVIALISGGSSSLLCLPRKGLTLAEKRRRVREGMEKGWPITRVNRLRSSLSLVKGGRLADATRARVLTIVLSDVPGADFRIVGSGPTLSRLKKRDCAVLLAGNRTGLERAAAWARSRGLRVRVERRHLSGEASVDGRRFAARLCEDGQGVLLAGGEPTVRRSSRAGSGGRSQELALGAALEFASLGCKCALLSAGSDGIDGNSKNAGAFADGTTVARARARRLVPGDFLRRHDSARFFEALGDHLRTGPTGGNVADWVFGVGGARAE